MRRGTIRSAILSASALSLAAAAWADLSKDMHRAFGKRHPRLVEHVALASEDGKNLLVRNAAWSLTLSRLVLDLGDVAPPFLTSESALARDRRSPLHHARRACICVDVKWPFDGARLRRRVGERGDRGGAGRARRSSQCVFKEPAGGWAQGRLLR